MNILITNLSPLRGFNKGENRLETREYTYITEEKDLKVYGTLTNEAAAKFYIEKFAKDNIAKLDSEKEKIDKIICFSTKEVSNDRFTQYTVKNKAEDEIVYEAKNITACEFFKDRIIEFIHLCEKKYNCECYKKAETNFKDLFIEIPLEDNIAETFIHTIREVEKLADNKPVFYIDTTGGYRHAVNALQLFIKFLTYKGYEVKSAVYSDWKPNKDFEKPDGKVQYVNVYELLEFLDGVNQFITTGQSEQLGNALADVRIKEEYDFIDNLLNSMKKFTDGIQLCKVDSLDETLKNMQASMIEAELKISDTDRQNNEKLVIFKQMIPMIREKFFDTKHIQGKEDYSVDYAVLVKWCVDNGLIQQALAIYVELIPKLIFSEIIEYEASENTNRNSHNSEEAALLYESLLEPVINNNEFSYDDFRNDYNKIKGYAKNKYWFENINEWHKKINKKDRNDNGVYISNNRVVEFLNKFKKYENVEGVKNSFRTGNFLEWNENEIEREEFDKFTTKIKKLCNDYDQNPNSNFISVISSLVNDGKILKYMLGLPLDKKNVYRKNCLLLIS